MAQGCRRTRTGATIWRRPFGACQPNSSWISRPIVAIKIKPSHKGLLHSELGVPKGKSIPAAKLSAAARSSNPAERKRAVFAENAKHWNHGGGKKLGDHFA